MIALFHCLVATALCAGSRLVNSQNVEEFHISAPMDMHGLAMDKFLQYRRDVDPNAKLDHESPLMKLAQEHAVRRFIARPESDLKLRVTLL